MNDTPQPYPLSQIMQHFSDNVPDTEDVRIAFLQGILMGMSFGAEAPDYTEVLVKQLPERLQDAGYAMVLLLITTYPLPLQAEP